MLEADACEIYTDVDGVYTTDPRLLPEARKMDRVSYDEMLELASLGAGVMHSRSIEFAKKFSVPIHVRNSSFSDVPGTMIGSRVGIGRSRRQRRGPDEERSPGDDRRRARSTRRELRDVFEDRRRNVAVDMIVQNVGADGTADISFTVLATICRPSQAVEEAAEELGPRRRARRQRVESLDRRPGHGHANRRGRRMFRALADAGINIDASPPAKSRFRCW